MKTYKVDIEIELEDEADGCNWIYKAVQDLLVGNEMITSFKQEQINESTD